MSLDWSCGALAVGLACYRKAEFFSAHEHWESVWLKLEEPEKSFLQALIQVTAALHHLRTGNCVGAASLLRRALQRLMTYPENFAGIVVGPLRLEICDWLQALESDGSIPKTPPEIRPV